MKKGFEKLLNVLLKKRYPSIIEVKVDTDDMDDITYYKIFVGIKYNDLFELDDERVRDDIKDLSKNVLNPNEKIYAIKYFDPKQE